MQFSETRIHDTCSKESSPWLTAPTIPCSSWWMRVAGLHHSAGSFTRRLSKFSKFSKLLRLVFSLRLPRDPSSSFEAGQGEEPISQCRCPQWSTHATWPQETPQTNLRSFAHLFSTSPFLVPTGYLAQGTSTTSRSKTSTRWCSQFPVPWEPLGSQFFFVRRTDRTWCLAAQVMSQYIWSRAIGLPIERPKSVRPPSRREISVGRKDF